MVTIILAQSKQGKSVYNLLVKRDHPDKLPTDTSDEERTTMTEYIAKISNAYNMIKEKRGFS